MRAQYRYMYKCVVSRATCLLNFALCRALLCVLYLSVQLCVRPTLPTRMYVSVCTQRRGTDERFLRSLALRRRLFLKIPTKQLE